MNAEEWARLKIWFSDALAASPEARPALIARLRGESAELAIELESLLARHDAHALATLDLTLQPQAGRPLPRQVPAGSAIGPYRVLRELGRGGTGLVFLAERSDDEFHRPVALKLLRDERRGPSGLTQERGSLARMQHANIATLLDWGTGEDGLPWMATEFVAGESIEKYCLARALPERAILSLFDQVADAVAYAHARGVVHRDLKPGNILVTDEGVVKLLDFGISSHTGAGGMLSFTPGYASPEQVAGLPPTAASDVYSLAVVLGQLLSRTWPPDFGHVSPGLVPILRHALASDPAARYPDVASFCADLDRYAADRPPRAVPTPWRGRSRLFLRRHRRTVIPAALAVVLGLAGVTYWQLIVNPSRMRRPTAALLFTPQPVDGAGAVLPLTLPVPTGGRVASLAVLTRGAADRDFTSADAAACPARFAAGRACLIHVRFAPTGGGARLGAVVARDARGNALATWYIAGTGAGAAMPPLAATPVRHIAGLAVARGLSTDGVGNAYFVEVRNGYVDELAVGATQPRVLVALPSLSGATAVDGAGNLFVSSTAANGIFRIANGQAIHVASLPDGHNFDNNLEVDGAGNLYASDQSGAIYMFPVGSRRTVLLYPGGQGHRFVGMASDLAGTLYGADFLNNMVFALPVGSDHLVRLVAPDGLLDQPHAIALGPDGEILVGNNYKGHLLRYAPGSWDVSRLAILGNHSLAFDGHHHLFAVLNNSQVVEYAPAPPKKP